MWTEYVQLDGSPLSSTTQRHWQKDFVFFLQRLRIASFLKLFWVHMNMQPNTHRSDVGAEAMEHWIGKLKLNTSKMFQFFLVWRKIATHTRFKCFRCDSERNFAGNSVVGWTFRKEEAMHGRLSPSITAKLSEEQPTSSCMTVRCRTSFKHGEYCSLRPSRWSGKRKRYRESAGKWSLWAAECVATKDEERHGDASPSITATVVA